MRLIDADALIQDNEKYFCETCKAKGHDYHEVACRACWVDDMKIAIEDAPTVDAVEVVRCKDCKHYDFGVCLKIYSDGAVSQYAWQARNEDDFCSYGERKDNELLHD